MKARLMSFQFIVNAPNIRIRIINLYPKVEEPL